MATTLLGRLRFDGSIQTELTPEELSAVTPDMLPRVSFKPAPCDEGPTFSLAPQHEEIYAMPGALNLELLHAVVPAALPLPAGYVRVVHIVWIFE